MGWGMAKHLQEVAMDGRHLSETHLTPHRTTLSWVTSVFLALLALAGTGCRANQQIQVLERELRVHEDEIYSLEDELDGLQAMLHSTRRENDLLRKKLGLVTHDDPIPLHEHAPSLPRRSTRPSAESMPDPVLEAPEVEIPEFQAPVIDPLPDMPEVIPGSDIPEVEPAPGTPGGPRTTTRPAGGVSRVEKITLNKMASGGTNPDGRVGDDGLMLILEPRNARGQLIEATGEIRVILRDPSRSGDQGFVAGWEFSAAEASLLFQRGRIGRGIYLELPWPAEPPTSRSLELSVRFITSDGRELALRQPLSIEPADVARIAPNPSLSWQQPGLARTSGPRRPATSTAPNDPDQVSPAEFHRPNEPVFSATRPAPRRYGEPTPAVNAGRPRDQQVEQAGWTEQK
jgi:hypothetical protein